MHNRRCFVLRSPGAIPMALVLRYTVYPGLQFQHMPKDSNVILERHPSGGGTNTGSILGMSSFRSRQALLHWISAAGPLEE